MEDNETHTVVCTRLRKVIPDETHIRIISDAVDRVHRITIDATELLTMHLTRCMAENLPVPTITKDYVKMVMMEVSVGSGTRTKMDEELTRTRTVCMPDLTPIFRTKIDQILMAQSISIAASFQTNLWMHFPKRLARYVRLHKKMEFHDKGVVGKQCQLRIMRIVQKMCSPTSPSIDDEDATWILEHRERLGCDMFTESSVEATTKRDAYPVLLAT